MCGIAGIRRMGAGGSPISIWMIEQLLLDASKRGIDATGVALQYRDGSVHVVKSADIAWRFLKTQNWTRFVDEHAQDEGFFKDEVVAVLGHARAASVGGAWKNENNHPVYDGLTAVTHNGGIRNHDYVFGQLKLRRRAEVDTDIVRAILDEWGFTEEAVGKLNQLSGPAALAAVSTAEPGKLLLARSGSPLVVAALKDAKQLMWSSRKEGIHKASRVWERLWGIEFQRNRVDLVFNPAPMETLWVFDEARLARSFRFTSNNGAVHELTYRCHDTHPAKKKEVRQEEAERVVTEIKQAVNSKVPGTALVILNRDKPELVECPNRCGALMQFSQQDEQVPIEYFNCPECGCSLAGALGGA